MQTACTVKQSWAAGARYNFPEHNCPQCAKCTFLAERKKRAPKCNDGVQFASGGKCVQMACNIWGGARQRPDVSYHTHASAQEKKALTKCPEWELRAVFNSCKYNMHGACLLDVFLTSDLYCRGRMVCIWDRYSEFRSLSINRRCGGALIFRPSSAGFGEPSNPKAAAILFHTITTTI